MIQLPQLPADKANHLMYGAALACAGAFHSVAAGAVLCAAPAVAKEVYDRISRKGTPDVLDVLATMAGGVLVLAPLVAWRLAA